MELTGESVLLRPLRDSDTAAWLTLLNDPAVMEGMDRIDAVTAEQHRAFYEKIIRPEPVRWFAIESRIQRGLAGGVWLWDLQTRHRRAEVRIFVNPAVSGKGYGTEAIALCARYAFEVLRLHKVYAYVHSVNLASERAFLRAGFFREAVLRDEVMRCGHYADVYRYARIEP